MSAAMDDTASSSCMSSCLPSFCRGKKSSVTERSLPPDEGNGNDARRQSVYYTAVQTHTLTEDELAALKELEEAAARGKDSPPSRQSQYFFDSLEEIDEEASMTYPPAACPDPHPRASVVMDNPATLLGAKKVPQRAMSRRRSSVARLLKAPRVPVQLQGYPGELTESEVKAALEFRSELEKKSVEEEDGIAYENMVRAFRKVEEVRVGMDEVGRLFLSTSVVFHLCSCELSSACPVGAVCAVPISTVQEF